MGRLAFHENIVSGGFTNNPVGTRPHALYRMSFQWPLQNNSFGVMLKGSSDEVRGIVIVSHDLSDLPQIELH